MFGLELDRPPRSRHQPPPTILAGPHLRLANARGAFSLLADALHPRRVWLPSFLCPVVLPAFRCPVSFFAIRENLEIADQDWIADVGEGDLVVFIDYFGLRNWDDSARLVVNRGGHIVEDACQAWLSPDFSPHADFAIGSPRKFFGVPDGGVLRALRGALPEAWPLPASPAPWWFTALTASIFRREYDQHGGVRHWFELFRSAEADGPIAPCRMSELSSFVIDELADWDAIATLRRANFDHLASELGSFAIFPNLPSGVVPLGFPIRVAEREPLRRQLFAADVFPPIHWPIAPHVSPRFAASHHLADTIMTLPCDQRYRPDDLDRMITIVSHARPAA